MTDVDKNDVIADFGNIFPGNTNFIVFLRKKTGTRLDGERYYSAAFQIDAKIRDVSEPPTVRGVDHFFVAQFAKACLFQRNHTPHYKKC